MSLDIFYKENKYQMIPLYFCSYIGKMIMKFLPECNFFNLSEHIRSLGDGFKYPTNHITKNYLVIFTKILLYHKLISIISHDFAGSGGIIEIDFSKVLLAQFYTPKKIRNQTTNQSYYT